MRRNNKILANAAVVASFLISSNAFTSSRIQKFGSTQCQFTTSTTTYVASPPLGVISSTVKQEAESAPHGSENSPSTLGQRIGNLVAEGNFKASVQVLKESVSPDSGHFVEDEAYKTILRALSDGGADDGPDIAEDVLSVYVQDHGSIPTSEICNIIISVWAKSSRQEAAEKCRAHLESLWDQHSKTGDERFVPMRSSYISTIATLSRSRHRLGRENAEKAEELLEEMEEKRRKYPQLSPNTIAVNTVLNTWSKSRLWHGSATRCEQILDRMIKLSKDRPELAPDTTSFNTVIDTLAKSKEYNREQRAEYRLEQMEELDSSNPSFHCRPDHVSFNAVINCWAQSQMTGAARRATSILSHMTKRYEADKTNVSPDAASYTTVINAWARSREPDAVERAEEVFKLCEKSYRKGNHRVKPNTLTYNSLINCYSKSSDADASEKALGLLETMKEKCKAEGFEDCFPDVVTYTSCIDALAKRKSVEAAANAESLLEELENAHKDAPDDHRLKPNVRTYTSVINAIGRSGKNPGKAEAILKRFETMAREEGDKSVAPDVVAFNALINAYGWSDYEGKSARCAAILRHMIEVSDSGENILATPDVITCNSILNACAFDDGNNADEHAEIMRVVVETLETFQRRIPKYGYPDHATFSQVLMAISRHLPPGDRRDDMAETTFWQCAHAGHVNSNVISSLYEALSWPRFSEVIGGALRSREGEKLVYNIKFFPKKWTRHAPQKTRVHPSRGSRKRDRGFQVTKQSLRWGNKK